MLSSMIPVVFSTDEKYLVPTCVAIISLLANADAKTFYNIYILVSSDKNNRIQSAVDMIQKEFDNCTISVEQIDESYFKDAVIRNEYLSVATYYRLVIAELLHGFDRCIYLDGDILVLGDLAAMFAIDMQDNYIAGVKAWNMYRESKLTKDLEKEMGVPVVSQYINAGVLVMNLGKIREENLQQEFLSHVSDGLLYEDQDILNMVCYPRVMHLEERYNTYSIFYKTPVCLKEFLDVVDERLTQQVCKPTIIHYSGMYVKPWENVKCKGAEEWYECLHKVPYIERLFKEEYPQEASEQSLSFEQLLELCKRFNKCYIWGYTRRNMLFYDDLCDKGICVAGFIDNDRKKQGMSYKGASVIDIEGHGYSSDELIILTISRYEGAMREQAQRVGYSNEQIIVYQQPGAWFYIGIDAKYYESQWEYILSNDKALRERYSGISLKKVAEDLRKNRQEMDIFIEKYRLDLWVMAV